VNKGARYRNPWHGTDAWKEFCYDARHPIHWVLATWHNANNRPHGERVLCAGVCVVGGANALLALVLILT